MKSIWVKISYFWFLIMLALVGLLSGNLKVNAASLNITNDSGWSGYYCGSTTGGSCGSHTSTGKTAYGTGVSLSNYYPIYGGASLFYGSSNYLATNTYSVSFRTHFSAYNNDVTYIKKHTKDWTYIVNGYVNSTTGYSDSYIKTYACSTRFDTTTTNGFITTCTFQLNENVSRIQVITSYYDYDDGANIYYLVNAMRVNFIALNYSEGVGSQIDNQTIVIENGFENIENTIENSTTNIIEGLKEQNMVCQKVTYTLANTTNYTNGYLNASGVFTTHATWKTSDYLETSGRQTTIYNANTSGEIPSICFYKEDKTLISCTKYNNRTSITITNPELAKYFRASFTLNNNTIVTTSICKNGNQAINDTLSDDNVDNPSSFLEDMEDFLPENGTITQLIALPLQLYQKVLNSIDGTCSAFDLGELYDTHLIMPCIDLSSYLGNTLWTTIDLIISGVFVITIAKKMVKAFNSFTSLKEGDVIND